MNRRNLLLLGAAAVATLGGAALLTPRGTPGPDEPPDAARLAFPGLTAKLPAAERIEIRTHNKSLDVLRRAGGERPWVLSDKGNYPARPERVRALLVALTELRLLEQRTAEPEQLARLGLDDPAQEGSSAVLLRVLDANGQVLAGLVVGHHREQPRREGAPAGAEARESLFVRFPEHNQSWLAEGRLPLDPDPQSWLDHAIGDIAHDRVRRVVVRRADAPELVVTRSSEPESRLAITTPANAPPADETGLADVAGALEMLSFGDVKPAAGDAGLGDAVGETRFECTDNLAVVARGFRQPDALWIRLAAEGDEEAARLNARWKGWAYSVGQWREHAFFPTMDGLKRQPPASPAAAPGSAAPGDEAAPAAAPPAVPAAPPSAAPSPGGAAPRRAAPR